MGELPEKFPEYSIMYKTLSTQIKTLEKRKKIAQENEIEGIELKIQKYHSEISKIKKKLDSLIFFYTLSSIYFQETLMFLNHYQSITLNHKPYCEMRFGSIVLT